jgi:hypothetical protein
MYCGKKGGTMKVFLSAGEASGDRFAAGLARALQVELPEAALCGFGASAMEAAGVRLLLDVTGTASIGLTEALATLPRSLPLLGGPGGCSVPERPDVFFCPGIARGTTCPSPGGESGPESHVLCTPRLGVSLGWCPAE